ncbi:GtrA family protein [Caulobacter mirabilis]|uniref:GtrA family protein n=1 Tax=Caulobacter mirabilis TaxID=69666 RepID=UPI001559330C|nr:GtrA family protein [Caulobacter mirabilis]
MSWKRHISGYAVVGLVSTGVHFAVALGLADLADFTPLAANACAFVSALLTSYVGNAVITFGSPIRSREAFIKFCAASLLAFALNQIIVHLLSDRLGVPFVASLFVVLFTVPPITFLLAKYWAFAPRKDG